MKSLDVIKNITKLEKDSVSISDDYIRDLFGEHDGDISTPKDYYTIDEIDSILSKTENTKYTTENGVKEFECKDGYVDNVYIEGETLVNLVRNNLPIQIWYGDRYVIDLVKCDYLKGTYTIFNFSNKKIYQDIGVAGSVNTWLRSITIEPRQSKTFDIVEGEQLFNVSCAFIDGWEGTDTSKNEFRNSTVLLEGDHTDKPISYFEGLKSVGQGDKIDVLTYPTNNENLITSDVTLYEDYIIPWETGELVSWVNSSEKYYATDYIEVEPNTEYIFANINMNMAYYDANKTFIPMPLSEGYGEKNCTYFYNTSPSNAKYVRLSIKSMYIGKPYMAKGKYIWDNKAISTTLRSLPNGVKDTIEKRGNKYVKVQRCGEYTLTGNESGIAMNDTFSQCISFRFDLKGVGQSNNSRPICNNFTHKYAIEDFVHFYLENDLGVICLLQSSLHSLDNDGFIRWVKEHPTTIVYELKTPIITELPNFNPQTYSDTTTLLLNTGAIQGECEFEVTNSKGSEIEVLKDKVSNLDDSLNENVIDIKSKVTFLNGWNFWGNEERFSVFIVGNMVKICILLAPGTRTVYTPIFKIPTEYAPTTKEFVTCSDQDNSCYVGCLDVDGLFVSEVNIFDTSVWTNVNITYPLRKKVF